MKSSRKIILASKSAARISMLQNAGLVFEAIPADLNEEKLITSMLQKDFGPQRIAEALAGEKASHVSIHHPQAIVIGADQVLECEGKIYSKAKDRAEAKEKLRELKGKSHSLNSAVCIVVGGQVKWAFLDEAVMHMNDFDEEFLERYCERAGDTLTNCVGAYALEGCGSWLFDKVRGDYFTILGMPLLPLLTYLREEHGLLP